MSIVASILISIGVIRFLTGSVDVGILYVVVGIVWAVHAHGSWKVGD